MGEAELERVMLAFMRHEADILVATTIIENGLDIPLCNTIIINRAAGTDCRSCISCAARGTLRSPGLCVPVDPA